MKGLDDYIMGTHIHHEERFLHRCPKCKREALILMFYELGGWFYPGNEKDEAYCHNCECELEIVAEESELKP